MTLETCASMPKIHAIGNRTSTSAHDPDRAVLADDKMTLSRIVSRSVQALTPDWFAIAGSD